jgi:hypothetical protein
MAKARFLQICAARYYVGVWRRLPLAARSTDIEDIAVKTLQIDPKERILVQAQLGRSERERLEFDNIDESEDEAIVKIDTSAVLPEFIRALIGPSVRRLGFKEFEKKYHFDTAPSVRESILESARVEDDNRAEREV